MISPSNRVSGVRSYYFARKLKEIAELRESGVDVINLGIGSPDMAPPQIAIDGLTESLSVEKAHQYQSYYGLPELREAFASFYHQQFQVSINAKDQVLPLIGSKEGIMHISMAYLNPGDEVLVPNPGYPAYQMCTELAGGTPRFYNLSRNNNWQIDLKELAKQDLTKVKILWINSPHMPTGAVSSNEEMKAVVQFGRDHNILICHDNPYAFILNDKPQSIFNACSIDDNILELTSLSKSHNMSGWRVGALVGKSKLLDPVIRFKSNMDSGMFKPVQLAAANALGVKQEWYDTINAKYKTRRTIAYQIMDAINCEYSIDAAGMFVWAKVNNESGEALSDRLLQDVGVFLTPGMVFGTQGESYIRLSLCSPVDVLTQALNRISTIS
jgi:aspartate/methionine/tyrosine aminotransferase